MVLQEAFRQNGYRDILNKHNPSEYGIHLTSFFESGMQPKELIGIYISAYKDDLFFLLNGDLMDINRLCDSWDDRIRVFSIIDGQSEVVQKLQYNIVQLIVYSGPTPDKNREGNLMISRKIIIKGNLTDTTRIEIEDDDAIELPFHMIPADAFVPDEEKTQRLKRLLPKDNGLLSLLGNKVKKAYNTNKEGVSTKSLQIKDFNMIREWLENDNP